MKKVLLAFGALLALSAQSYAQSVAIRGVRLVGSGCSNSTASAITTSDGQTLSVLFDHYSVEIGQGSANPAATSLQKDCHVLIDVDVPPNMQFGLQQTDYRGFAAIPASAWGFHRFTQIVPNQAVPSAREATIKGPTSGDYAVTVMQKPGRFVYTTCNRPSQTIDLLSQLAVNYYPNTIDRSLATINLDSVDTGVHSSFKLSWRRCR